MALVEREKEAAQLDRLIFGCVRGKGSAAVITGPVGCGKTALMQSAAERAVAAGALFLRADSSYAERHVPLGVLNQMLRSLTPGGTGPNVMRLLDNGATGRGAKLPEIAEIDQADHVRADVIERFDHIVRNVTARQPLVLAVDDVHYADAESLPCLAYLARRAHTLPLLILLTESTQIQLTRTLLHAELMSHSRCRHIHLRPLSRTAAAQLHTKHDADQLTDEFLTECYALTSGNPALVRALIDDAGGTTGRAREPIIGPSFHHALMSCLYRAPRRILSLARVIAVLGDLAEPALLAAVVGMDTGRVVRATAVLNETGLFQDGRFRHSAVRAAVLDGMPAGERAALHGQAAQLLHEAGAAATVVAEHLLAAGEIGGWAIHVLHEAAQRALSGGGIDSALRCLQLAYRADADEARRASTQAALARVEWRLDPCNAARYTARLTESIRHGHVDDRAAVTPIGSLLWFGRIDEALEALDDLDHANSSAGMDTAVAARVMISCAYPPLTPRVLGSGPPERLMIAASTVNPELRAFGILATVLAHGPSDELTASAERILQNARLDDGSVISVVASLTALTYSGRLETAAFWCDAHQRVAESLRARMWQAAFSALHAEIAYRQGDLPAADKYGQAAISLVPPESWGVAVGVPLATLIRASSALGQPERTASYLRILLPDTIFQSVAGLVYLRARGVYHRAIGDLAGALADFRTCGELMMRWRMDFPTLIPWRTEAARTLTRMGRNRYARNLIDEQLTLLSRPQHGHRATSKFKPATVSGTLGKTAMEADLTTLAALLRGTAAPEPPRLEPVPVTELTDAEQRVAVLAAQGLSNRQIAKKLFVTVSTVEQHLTRAYRKLRVNSRDHLPSRLFVQVADYQ